MNKNAAKRINKMILIRMILPIRGNHFFKWLIIFTDL